ncbi:MAG: DNA-3-methyladenine glycosylase I [Candidatus Omnitrophota bacterium]|nr:DNA-3-methyladenine glycosylase I [Candidatus Omnitrophota bacterium]
MREIKRCGWAEQPEILRKYHDTEWGVPLHNDRKLFEFLVLEGMQAGLSWLCVLNKRENFRRAFDRFYPEKVARYRRPKIQSLLKDAGIIRNQLKVESAVTNARAFLKVQEEFGSFQRFMWGFVDGKPLVHRARRLKELPARNRESDALSKELIRRGFRFVGSTICYAHMQATGMVNDHLLSCFRHAKTAGAGAYNSG